MIVTARLGLRFSDCGLGPVSRLCALSCEGGEGDGGGWRREWGAVGVLVVGGVPRALVWRVCCCVTRPRGFVFLAALRDLACAFSDCRQWQRRWPSAALAQPIDPLAQLLAVAYRGLAFGLDVAQLRCSLLRARALLPDRHAGRSCCSLMTRDQDAHKLPQARVERERVGFRTAS